ncbi:MAG: RNA methyltransferase [Myxococcales bacterium]|nr:RNA methyltransferase [Myxococcales bacterium]MCB9577504.1 RNA methyltransferase [Polyangiaceae bacterium]
MRSVAALLAHHPVLDRQREVVTTAITNLDLHDISRSAYTYGLSHLFVAHPVQAQRELALRVRSHWTEGSGAKRIPDRKPAMGILTVVTSLDDALAELGQPEIWVTSAQAGDRPSLSYEAARDALKDEGPSVLIVFGTGWGLAPSVLERAAAQLEPVKSPRADGYNHLSVRAAAAITFDRLLGPR